MSAHVSAAPLIPRSVLFGNPDHAGVAISPDGTRVGWVAPEDGVLNVWVAPRSEPQQAQAITHDRDRGVRTFMFCHDDRHLLYLQDSGGDENWRVYLLDLDDPESPAQLITAQDGIQARLLAHNRWNPTTVLLGVNDRVQQLHDVHRLDLTTGEVSLVAENPGFLQWLIDPQLKLRGGLTMNPDGSTVLHLGAEGAYQPYLQIPAEDSASTGPVGFTRSGALLMLSSIGQNATRLERHDLSDGRVEVLAQDPQYDVSDVWQDPETLEVQAVEVQRARQDIQVLDDALAEHIANLRALTDGELSIGRRERSGQWWTVSVAPSNGAVQYWIYDSSCGQATFLFPHRQDLADLPTGSLAPVEPFSFIARDGLTIHGYVTFPVGVRRTGLPCVVMVHGGPWARDSWDFDPQVQWLANRGYVCVQVNFRGSTGYGKEFLNAGNKQWGKAMQDDVSDAVEYVVNQEWVDPDRVGIYGGSYGGYAVLAAAVFTPQLFRCGVDVVGPSNLHTLLASVPEYWKPMIALMHQRVGNPETEAELLTQASPLTHVDQIRMPLLIVQGANDPRVKQAEAEQIVAALKDKGLPHSYLLFDDEGHGLAKPQNREVMFAAAEEFFAEHLGGRAQPDQLERDDGCGAG